MSASNEHRYLCFNLGQEEYGIPLLSVKEVIGLPPITPVPQTPSYFLGIINLRGQVITVMDLRTKLGIKSKESQETAVIICDLMPNSIGVVVDSINSVIAPMEEQLSERPEVGGSKNHDYIQGVYRSDDRLVLLLNIAKTLNVADQQAVARHSQPVQGKVA